MRHGSQFLMVMLIAMLAVGCEARVASQQQTGTSVPAAQQAGSAPAAAPAKAVQVAPTAVPTTPVSSSPSAIPKPAQPTTAVAASPAPAKSPENPPASTPGPRPFKLTAAPSWIDTLNGKSDSGVETFTLPQTSGPQPATKVGSWIDQADGKAANLATMDAYVGYQGSRLRADQGTVLFKFRPAADLVGTYGKRHPTWTDFGQNKPPQSGFLLDTIGWRGAPKGSFGYILDPSAAGTMSFGVWDGGKWHYVHWKTPDGWQWSDSRWYELGITWGPKGQAILVDGEVKSTIPDVVQVNTAIPWFLGQAPGYWPYGPHSLIGAYDDLKVYGEQPAW